MASDNDKRPAVSKNFLMHLAKGGAKCIPIAGGLLEEMIFGTLAGEAAEREAAELRDALQTIQAETQEQSCTLAEVLVKANKAVALSEQTRSIIDSLASSLRDVEVTPPSEAVAKGVERYLEKHLKAGELQTANFDALLSRLEAAISEINRERDQTTLTSDFIPGVDRISLAKLPTTSPDLFGREEELNVLDAAWENSDTNVVTLVAFGGVGKTALVNKWLLQMGQDSYRGAQRVYGWSFYSQGAAEGKQASADQFIAAALQWFGDPDPTEGSPWDKGERLAALVREHRTLLILDGLEPLQHPPGAPGHERRLKDPALQSLLRELAWNNSGLCVVTTRLTVEDLQEFTESTVHHVDLEDLSPEASAALLKKLGVNGTDDELQQAAKEFGGHALALTLLGRYLATVYHGDIHQRDKIAELTKAPKEGGHAIRMMETYEGWFKDKPELDILRMLGLFDRPANAGAIETLKAKPAIKGLTSEIVNLSHDDWKFALRNLREARLLADEDPQDVGRLDCHPLIREHFGPKLKADQPDAWKEAHARLYEHYKSLPDKHLPDTLEEMAPLYLAVTHGCHAQQYNEAFHKVYGRRICRGNEAFATKKIGAFGADLAALAGFFEEPWTRPVEDLAETHRGIALNLVGYRLRALGRLAEAVEPMKAGLSADINRKDWRNSAIAASNLSELYLTVGDVAQALDYARQSVELADRSQDAFQRMARRTTLADALHQAGHLDEAEAAFREAEKMQKARQPECPLLYSSGGHRYCDLLLEKGEYQDVLERAEQTLVWVTEQGWLLDIALDHLSLGRAYLLAAKREGTGDFSAAAKQLDQAVDGLRESGNQDEIPRGLLARAELFRVRKDFERARRDLDEAMSIATRGGMRLFECDCHLEDARLHLAQGSKAEARNRLTTAKTMIEEMGYHRRDKDATDIKSQL